MSMTFGEELKTLLELVAFKKYKRYGDLLYAPHMGGLKAERSISELVWGWCRNPCFVTRLHERLEEMIPDRQEYPKILADANRKISEDNLFETLDDAMASVVRKDAKNTIAYSIESTSRYNSLIHDPEALDFMRVFRATDDDGELWNGLLVPEGWEDVVDQVTVRVYRSSSDNKRTSLWQQTFLDSAIAKRIKQRDGVSVFQPFIHPMLLIDLDVDIVVEIFSKTASDLYDFDPSVKQLFGIVNTNFLDWIKSSSFKLHLDKRTAAVIDMRAEPSTIEIVNK